jgi:arylformamidase
VDAQSHFISDGNSIDIEPLDKFIGEAITLDMTNVQIGGGITDIDLEIHSTSVSKKDIVLLYTGTSERWAIDESIRNKFTYLELSGAKWIVDHGIKCVGIDTLSVEKYGFKEGMTHKKLLSGGVGIIENLNSTLRRTIGVRIFLFCMPLPLKGVDGTPTRAVAFSIV